MTVVVGSCKATFCHDENMIRVKSQWVLVAAELDMNHFQNGVGIQVDRSYLRVSQSDLADMVGPHVDGVFGGIELAPVQSWGLVLFSLSEDLFWVPTQLSYWFPPSKNRQRP